MALSGELSDLSLSELIEFFCNQRKTGRLKVIYPHLPGYFYIQAGALVDARIGTLSGIDAVYYALTLPNASFTFDMEIEVEQRTIHQPWTQVVLEGLRRMDEGISPEPPLNKEELPDEHDLEEAFESVISHTDNEQSAGPMAMTVGSMAAGGGSKRKVIFGALAIMVLGIVALGVIVTNRFASAESTAAIPPVAVSDTSAESSANTTDDNAGASTTTQIAEAEPSNQATVESGAAAQLRDHEARERERRRAAEERADARMATDAQTAPATTPADALKKPDAPKAGPKTVTVQVTYDEAGRVTQASGSDATALRIARQKRFPSGKPGTTTVTIPVN